VSAACHIVPQAQTSSADCDVVLNIDPGAARLVGSLGRSDYYSADCSTSTPPDDQMEVQ